METSGKIDYLGRENFVSSDNHRCSFDVERHRCYFDESVADDHCVQCATNDLKASQLLVSVVTYSILSMAEQQQHLAVVATLYLSKNEFDTPFLFST